MPEPLLYSAGAQFRNQIEMFVNVKLFAVVSEEAMGLMSPMVLGAETPVNVWKNQFPFEVYCTEDTTTYFLFPSSEVRSREKTGL
jgi:hypothetical protein